MGLRLMRARVGTRTRAGTRARARTRARAATRSIGPGFGPNVKAVQRREGVCLGYAGPEDI